MRGGKLQSFPPALTGEDCSEEEARAWVIHKDYGKDFDETPSSLGRLVLLSTF